MPGLDVCMSHGGGTAAAKRRAKENLALIAEQYADPNMVIKGLAVQAFGTLKDAFNADGTMKSSQDWTDEVWQQVAGIKVLKVNRTAGDGRQEDAIEIKREPNRIRAQELIGTHLGMFVKKTEIDVGPDLAAILTEARARTVKGLEPVAEPVVIEGEVVKDGE